MLFSVSSDCLLRIKTVISRYGKRINESPRGQKGKAVREIRRET